MIMTFFKSINYLLFIVLLINFIFLGFFIIKLNFRKRDSPNIVVRKIKKIGKISLIIWLLILLNIFFNILYQ
jgi:hypothetical protein